MNAIELFCCSGGMAEGFRRAGIRFEFAFDANPDACDSYEQNLGHRPVQMDVRDLLRLASAQYFEPSPWLDLVVADPPCTPWSRAGKRRGLDDDRDMLAATCELLALLKPRTWLIGNVPGLDDSTNADAVTRTIGTLSKQYCIDYVRLDAADYGVPQHRVRPFWFGHPHGTDHISWPIRTHGDPRCAELPWLFADHRFQPWVTCRAALQHLPLEQLGRPVRVRAHASRGEPASDPDAPAHALTRNTHGSGALLAHPRHPINLPDEPSFTITSKGDGRGAQGACCIEWPWDRPATTVTGDSQGRLAPPGHHGKSFLSDNRGHGPNAVRLSERAGAILQGFPDGWVFCGATKKARWSQLGQAMPPALAEAVARSIVRWRERAERAA